MVLFALVVVFSSSNSLSILIFEDFFSFSNLDLNLLGSADFSTLLTYSFATSFAVSLTFANKDFKSGLFSFETEAVFSCTSSFSIFFSAFF